MKTKKQLIEEIQASSASFIIYGDMSTPTSKEEAIADIRAMDEEMIGNGDWEECCAKIDITFIDDNGTDAPLFYQPDMQNLPLPTFLTFDPNQEEIELTAEYTMSRDSVPCDVWNRLRLRFSVNPAVSRYALEELSDNEEVFNLLTRIKNGSEEVWKNSNKVRLHDGDAKDAEEKLQYILEGLETIDVWAAEDWVYEGFSLEELIKMGINDYALYHDTNDIVINGDLESAVCNIAEQIILDYIHSETEGCEAIKKAAEILAVRDDAYEYLVRDYREEFKD